MYEYIYRLEQQLDSLGESIKDNRLRKRLRDEIETSRRLQVRLQRVSLKTNQEVVQS